ncbi:hypothetical protein IFM51744_10044 [Aspergillus udagawae]|nr:hypothetical protein IFM51744_10044 [Aspergillus udagawae]
MYKCSEKFTLETERLSYLEKPLMESIDQETLEEEEVIKTSEEDFDPISDDEEDAIEQCSTVLASSEGATQECMMSDVSPMHDCDEQEDEEEYEENEEEAADDGLLPPPIQQLSDRSQKRSSGRVTVPSSRLQGYEVY